MLRNVCPGTSNFACSLRAVVMPSIFFQNNIYSNSHFFNQRCCIRFPIKQWKIKYYSWCQRYSCFDRQMYKELFTTNPITRVCLSQPKLWETYTGADLKGANQFSFWDIYIEDIEPRNLRIHLSEIIKSTDEKGKENSKNHATPRRNQWTGYVLNNWTWRHEV